MYVILTSWRHANGDFNLTNVVARHHSETPAIYTPPN